MAYGVYVAPTGKSTVDGLLSGVRWNTANLTFSFPTLASQYGADYNWAGGYAETRQGFAAFTAAQQTMVRSVLAEYSSFANLTFTETSGGAGDMRFGRSGAVDSSGAYAWAYMPTAGAGGDAWFKQSWTTPPQTGTFDYLAVMHEIGHALGLKHSFETSGSFGAMPSSLDGNDYTIMSYQAFPGAGYNVVNYLGSYAQTPMLYDIQALQSLYGANFNTNAGATTYRWSQTTGEMFINGVGQGAPAGARIEMTLWDGGGFDTYDFSAYTRGLRIDLNPGSWVTETNLAGSQVAQFSPTAYAPGMIANAFLSNGDLRSLIEAANGGSANDILVGNQANNLLNGNAGNDTLQGGAGADTLVGGLGADSLDGGDGFDTASYAAATGGVTVDLGTGLGAGAEATGDLLVRVEAVIGSGSNDVLRGDANANLLDGGAGLDQLYGGAGADTLLGGAGDDLLVGGAGADSLDGGAGMDTASYATATAGVAIDLLMAANQKGDAAGDVFTGVEHWVGSAYADSFVADNAGRWFDGAAGVDSIKGGTGADALFGGAGDDWLSGGLGADSLSGGDGFDALSYADSAVAVSVNLQSGAVSGGAAAGDVISGFEAVVGSSFNDVLTGDAGANRLEGGAGADQLLGGAGADTLLGGAGDDILLGGVGADSLDGGAGFDAVSYASALAGVRLSLADPAQGLGDAAGDRIAGIEAVIGSSYADMITGDALANRLQGGGGADMLVGGGGADTLSGGAGADVFVFGVAAGKDVISDFVAGGADHDVIRLLGTSMTSYANLLKASAQVGADVCISLSANDTITLSNVSLSNLAMSDFLFA
jgi:serralysin